MHIATPFQKDTDRSSQAHSMQMGGWSGLLRAVASSSAPAVASQVQHCGLVVFLLPNNPQATVCIDQPSSLSAARWTVACVGHVGSFAPTCQCHSPMRAEAVVSRHTYCRAQQPGIDLLPSPWTAPQARACVRRTRSLSGAARGRRLLAASAGLARARALPWPPLSRSYKIHMRR